MSKIRSDFDSKESVYETAMPVFSKNKLKIFCQLFGMKFDDLKNEKTGKYLLLGRIVLCMIPETIMRIKKENPEFHLNNAHRIDPSYRNGGIEENPMSIDDHLIFKIQIKCNSHRSKSCLTRIEITRDNFIVFAGLFNLTEK